MANNNSRRRTKNTRRTKKRQSSNNSISPTADEQILNEPIVVGLVYANWCPHCTQMKPQWNKMKNEFNGNDHYTVVEIEADQPDRQERITELESKLNGKTIDAAGYPTIFKLNNGDIEYYNGERNASDMKQWATIEQYGGFQIDKHREMNRRKPNNLTPKHTPFAPRKRYKSKSLSNSRSKSMSKSKSKKQ